MPQRYGFVPSFSKFLMSIRMDLSLWVSVVVRKPQQDCIRLSYVRRREMAVQRKDGCRDRPVCNTKTNHYDSACAVSRSGGRVYKLLDEAFSSFSSNHFFHSPKSIKNYIPWSENPLAEQNISNVWEMSTGEGGSCDQNQDNTEIWRAPPNPSVFCHMEKSGLQGSVFVYKNNG
jgi:hypothetical protein